MNSIIISIKGLMNLLLLIYSKKITWRDSKIDKNSVIIKKLNLEHLGKHTTILIILKLINSILKQDGQVEKIRTNKLILNDSGHQ